MMKIGRRTLAGTVWLIYNGVVAQGSPNTAAECANSYSFPSDVVLDTASVCKLADIR